MAKPQIGDTRGWNERDQTGYRWENTVYGERWVQYYKGKARHIGGVDLFSAPRQIGNFAKSFDIRDRVEDEGLSDTPDQQSRNYTLWLQNKIANSETEREKSKWLTQYWDLMGFDQADIIKEERGEGENWIIPERTWENPFYGDERDRLKPEIAAAETKPSTGDLSMFEEDPEDVLDTKVNNNEAKPITPTEDPKPISQKYTRPTASERQERRMEDALVRGRPLEKFKLEKERNNNKIPGTNVNDLFTKNRGR